MRSGGTGQQGLMSDQIRAVSFCSIFLFFLFLWPSEESVLSCSVCERTAVGAPGLENGWARISLLSWLAAECSHGCFSENQSPNSQGTAVCFAWKSLCKVHLDVHLFHPCQRKAGIYLLAVKYCSAEAQEWLSGVEIEFYNSRLGVQGQTPEERAGTSDTSFLHVFCCLMQSWIMASVLALAIIRRL